MFTTTQQAEIDAMVRTGQIPSKPPYHQSHVWLKMVREVKAQRALLPPTETYKKGGKIHYETDRRFQGFYNGKWYAIHEEGPDGGPLCYVTDKWQDARHLGYGGVTCGHCANKNNS